MSKRILMNRLLISYILVGLLNTAFGYSIFVILIYAKFHYTLAVLFATVLGVLFNFKTIGRLVFRNNDNTLIFRFVAVYVITYLLNVAGLRIYRIYDDNMYLAGFLMLIPATAISFVLHNRFVFREKVL